MDTKQQQKQPRQQALSDLSTPAFVVNREAFTRNCQRCLRHASQSAGGIRRLRPHIKTHKTFEGAYIQAFGRPSQQQRPSSPSSGSRNDDAAAVVGGAAAAVGGSSNTATTTPTITGFVASTLPEIVLLLEGADALSTSQPDNNNNNSVDVARFRDILYGIPISRDKLIRIHDEILPKHPPAKISLLIDHPDQLTMIQETLTELEKAASDRAPANKKHKTMHKFGLFIKLDTGYHRAGIPAYYDSNTSTRSNDDDATKTSSAKEYFEFAERVMQYSPQVEFRGLYSHCGHAYDTSGAAELDKIARRDLANIAQFIHNMYTFLEEKIKRCCSPRDRETEMQLLVASLAVQQLKLAEVSIGSTPSLFHHDIIRSANIVSTTQQEEQGALAVAAAVAATPTSTIIEETPTTQPIPYADILPLYQNKIELHPGNYTMYDRQQLWSGACEAEAEIAGRVLARVIGQYPDRQAIMLDAGATALTKDMSPGDNQVCGLAGYPDLECYKMSQEVTLVRVKKQEQQQQQRQQQQPLFPFDEFPLGRIVTLLPNHSCLSAACFDKYYVVDDPTSQFGPNQSIVDTWIPAKGW